MYSPEQMRVARKHAQALLNTLTLAEKVGQMTLTDQSTCSPQQVHDFHIGAVMSAAGSCPGNNTQADWLALIDSLWLASQKRHGTGAAIPILYGLDAIHGNANVRGATVFPHNINLGACRSTDAISQTARMTADEVRAIGANWMFGPNLAIAEHYHWGRTYESVAQDAEAVAEFARKYVQGVNHARDDYPILTCAKHWIGDGGTEHGIEQGNARFSMSQLDKHMLPFKAAIKAGALSVMVAFSSVNGEKCHGNAYLIQQRLKNELGFAGFVISDMQGVNFIDDDFYLAIGQSVNAGIDMFMVPQNWQQFQNALQKHLSLGTISLSRIDDAVLRILTVKYLMGLFEQSLPSIQSLPWQQKLGCRGHRQAAREIAAQSCVLLKNEQDLLPLSQHSRMLVVGEHAHHAGSQCGGFTLEWQGVKTPGSLSGMCTLWEAMQSVLTNAQFVSLDDLDSIDAAEFDVALVVIGEQPYAEGMGDIRQSDQVLFDTSVDMSGALSIQPPYGRSLALADLHPQALTLLKNVKRLGLPIATLLINGRPLVVDQELAESDAFMVGWLPGSEGLGLLDALIGQVPDLGQLAFDWPSYLNEQNCRSDNAGDLPYKTIWRSGHGVTYLPQENQHKTN